MPARRHSGAPHFASGETRRFHIGNRLPYSCLNPVPCGTPALNNPAGTSNTKPRAKKAALSMQRPLADFIDRFLVQSLMEATVALGYHTPALGLWDTGTNTTELR